MTISASSHRTPKPVRRVSVDGGIAPAPASWQQALEELALNTPRAACTY
ncbi:hypothetical protein [Embleya sp. AB8]